MPMKCGICAHPQVEAINRALLEGGPGGTLRNIAGRHGVTKTSLHRHSKHLPAGMVKAQHAEEVAKADTLLDQVAKLRDRAMSILEQAEQAGDLRTALIGVREAKGCLELLAKLQGELVQEGTVSVTISPQWLSLRAIVLQTLEPYPEARLRLAAALREAENNVG